MFFIMIDYEMCGLDPDEAELLIGQMFDLAESFQTEGPLKDLSGILLEDGDPYLSKDLATRLEKPDRATHGAWQKAYAQACLADKTYHIINHMILIAFLRMSVNS